MAHREHYPYRIKISDAPRDGNKFTPEVRATVSESLANSAIDTLMSSAQPALNPKVEIWGDPTHVYFDMTVDKPDDSGEANQWRIGFNAVAFKTAIAATILVTMTEMESGTYENKRVID